MMKTDDKIIITFPDGNERKFIKGVTGNEIAESISKSLQKKAIAIKVNGIANFKPSSSGTNEPNSIPANVAICQHNQRVLPVPIK